MTNAMMGLDYAVMTLNPNSAGVSIGTRLGTLVRGVSIIVNLCINGLGNDIRVIRVCLTAVKLYLICCGVQKWICIGLGRHCHASDSQLCRPRAQFPMVVPPLGTRAISPMEKCGQVEFVGLQLAADLIVRIAPRV
jgi:hypothetical protein